MRQELLTYLKKITPEEQAILEKNYLQIVRCVLKCPK